MIVGSQGSNSALTMNPSQQKHWNDQIRGLELRREFAGRALRVQDVIEGTQIFGATGSGKTSGSGSYFARAFLDPSKGSYGGFGGLVLTAKGDEIDDWRSLLRQVGREEDLLVFEPAPGKQFNFLEYERAQPSGGGLTQNLVSLFLAAMSGGGSAAVSRTDPYWDESLRELLTHTVDLAVLGTRSHPALTDQHSEGFSLSSLFDIVRSAPQTLDEARSTEWRARSTCARLLLEAERRRNLEFPGESAHVRAGRAGDLDQTQAYWLRDFPSLAERTRSIIVSSFTAKAAGLLRSPLRELLCSGSDTATFAPERTFEGKVLVIQLPVKHYEEVGRFAQVLYKTVWQRAVERRVLAGQWRPVFLWADEAQYFVTKADALYQQTARAKYAATVYLTQNLPNYFAALDGSQGTAATESLLGNLQTKIFHANGDPATNEWGERVIGHHLLSTHSGSVGGRDVQTSVSSSLQPLIPAARFTELRRGSPDSNFEVDAIVFRPGGRGAERPKIPHHLVTFRQEHLT